MDPDARGTGGKPPEASAEVTIWLSAEDHERLCAMVAATGASPTRIFTHAVQSYLSAMEISDVPPPGPLESGDAVG